MGTILFAAIISAVFVMVLVPFVKNVIPAKLLAAASLASMAFIYVGFALMENSPGIIAFETTVAVIFFFIAVIGHQKCAKLIAFGILLHGIWDIVHHFTGIAHASPSYWWIYCSTIDIIWAVYFFIVFDRTQEISGS